MNKIIILSLVLGCVYGGEVAYGASFYNQCRAVQDAARAQNQVAVATQGRAAVTAKRKTGAKKFTVLLNRAKRFFCGNKQEGVANLTTQAQFAQLQAVTENVQVAEHKTGAKKLASLVWGHRRGIMKATFWTCVGGITLTFAGSGMMHQLALASPAAKEFIYKNGLYKIAYCAGWGANMTVNMARTVWQLLGCGN